MHKHTHRCQLKMNAFFSAAAAKMCVNAFCSYTCMSVHTGRRSALLNFPNQLKETTESSKKAVCSLTFSLRNYLRTQMFKINSWSTKKSTRIFKSKIEMNFLSPHYSNSEHTKNYTEQSSFNAPLAIEKYKCKKWPLLSIFLVHVFSTMRWRFDAKKEVC